MTTRADAAALARLEGVSKSFGAVRAVDDVSLAIAPGEFFALLGPSGCGKTTLMRLLAGFETPERGAVIIDGADMARTPPHRRSVNMMFQSYALFPHLSVAGNIGFGLVELGMARREIAARVEEMLRLARLEGYGGRKPRELSGGQRQRVALVRALARQPRLLLLDEPLAALDRRLRETTRHELIAVQRRLGTSFVMVTHDQEEAMAMADRIAVMRAGRIEQIGAPADIYERPATRFVAGFVGDINLIEARLTAREGGRARFATADGPLLVAAAGDGLAPGGAATLAVRPEHVTLAAADGAANALDAQLVEATYLGGRTQVRLRLPSGATLRAVTPGAADPWRVGAPLRVAFDPARVSALPPEPAA